MRERIPQVPQMSRRRETDLLKLFCPVCKKVIDYNPMPNATWHHWRFGVVCSGGCYRDAEQKALRMQQKKDGVA